MKHLFFIAFAFLALSCRNQATQPAGQISIGVTDSIHSDILGEERNIFVHVPPDYTPGSTQRYPVIYVTDGEAFFESLTGMTHQFSEVFGNMMCPRLIVVGIPNTERARDLTPTHIARRGGNEDSDNHTGGGEKFTAFLEHELIPYIESKYPTAPYRMLIGHSLGGLFTMNTLIHHTDLFNSYIAIDPSMWWDHQKLLHQADSAFKTKNFSGKSLYLSIANTMGEGLDTTTVRKDTMRNTQHIRSILELKDDLQHDRHSGLRWSYRYYPNDVHLSVPLISMYDGIRFLFDFYTDKGLNSIYDDSLAPDEAVAVLNERFENISNQMGYAIRPPEGMIDDFAHGLLRNHPEKALKFFELAVATYPDSPEAQGNMGDYYLAMGDTLKARETYARALAGKELPDLRRKAEALKPMN